MASIQPGEDEDACEKNGLGEKNVLRAVKSP